MKHRGVQYNSFFIEIILVILFFSISVAVTLQLFVAANSRAQQSSDLSVAVIKAENIAEQVKSLTTVDALPMTLATAKPSGSGNALQYTIGYDKEWHETKTDPCYVIDVTMNKAKSDSGTMVIADISINRLHNSSTESLYRLNSAKYLPNR